MLMAEIAAALIASDESLMAPQNRDRLLEAVKASFNRDHTVAITLTKRNLAAVELMAARTNELPQA
jgi:seryl-tRNA(Sec) selenium transferase